MKLGIMHLFRQGQGESLNPPSDEGIFSLRRNRENHSILHPMKAFSLSGGQEQGESFNPPFNEGILSLRRPGTEGTFHSSSF
jgi:hypothetical protein